MRNYLVAQNIFLKKKCGEVLNPIAIGSQGVAVQLRPTVAAFVFVAEFEIRQFGYLQVVRDKVPFLSIW